MSKRTCHPSIWAALTQSASSLPSVTSSFILPFYHIFFLSLKQTLNQVNVFHMALSWTKLYLTSDERLSNWIVLDKQISQACFCPVSRASPRRAHRCKPWCPSGAHVSPLHPWFETQNILDFGDSLLEMLQSILLQHINAFSSYFPFASCEL